MAGGPERPLPATPAAGLTAEQVAARRPSGLGYTEPESTSRSVPEILRANILTRFNFILGSLLAVILILGEPQDALFGIVLVANALIGIGQELRAKSADAPRSARVAGPSTLDVGTYAPSAGRPDLRNMQ